MLLSGGCGGEVLRFGRGARGLSAMRSRAVGALVLLLVLVLVSAGDASAGVRRAHAGRASLVADSGFRPQADGYVFANYANSAARPNLDSGEMQLLFGNGVCAGFAGGVCVLSPP